MVIIISEGRLEQIDDIFQEKLDFVHSQRDFLKKEEMEIENLVEEETNQFFKGHNFSVETFEAYKMHLTTIYSGAVSAKKELLDSIEKRLLNIKENYPDY